MHRVRVGLMGLAGVFVLVMLAAAVLRLAGQSQQGGNAGAAENADATPTEPLAQLGVAPGNAPPSDATPPTSRVPSTTAAPRRANRR